MECIELYVYNEPWDEFDDLALIRQMEADPDNPRVFKPETTAFIRRTREQYMAKAVRNLDARDVLLIKRHDESIANLKTKLAETTGSKKRKEIAETIAALKGRRELVGTDREEQVAFWEAKYGKTQHSIPVGRMTGLTIGALKQIADKLDSLTKRMGELEKLHR
ncbi:hypothetical protein ES708_28144 [subsurface metagenome]